MKILTGNLLIARRKFKEDFFQVKNRGMKLQKISNPLIKKNLLLILSFYFPYNIISYLSLLLIN